VTEQIASYCCKTFERAVKDKFIMDWSEENRQRYGDNLPLFTLCDQPYHNLPGDMKDYMFFKTTFQFCPWCGSQQSIMVLR
jgi:hypothetical protein